MQLATEATLVASAANLALNEAPAAGEARYAQCALTPDGRELTCDRGDRVLRFALPR